MSFKDSFAFLQKIGKSLMMPIAVLPAAGLLLAFGNFGVRHFKEQGLELDKCEGVVRCFQVGVPIHISSLRDRALC